MKKRINNENNKFLLMSIKTKHANKIFSGIKTFEYRTKSIKDNNLNKYCLIYSSEDEKAVIGYVVFDYIVEGSADYLINNTNPESINGLKEYLSNKEKGYALHIKEYKKFDNPITLKELRNSNDNFNIPQYYRYLKKGESLYLIAKKMTKIHQMNLRHEFFNYIKNGNKRIELRLYDEKRKLIKIADKIEFTDLDTNNKIETVVRNIYRFNSFNDLIDNFSVDQLADIKYSKNDLIDILNSFYTKDEQRKCGVVGIEVDLNENI